MNCKNCEYAIKCRSLQDNEWYTRCTYEEGECVKIADLEDKLANADYQLEGRDNEIDELKVQIKVLEQNLEDTEICENGWKNRVRELEAQIEKMKCDLLELRNDSYDAGMYLRIDELIQKWEIKEND